MMLFFFVVVIGMITAWALGRKPDAAAQERARTVGSALRELSRVQGLGPFGGASPDLGPPPPDRVDDDTYTVRLDAPPRQDDEPA